MSESCTHLDQIVADVAPDSAIGCSDCLAIGSTWVHLRECMSCGHVALSIASGQTAPRLATRGCAAGTLRVVARGKRL